MKRFLLLPLIVVSFVGSAQSSQQGLYAELLKYQEAEGITGEMGEQAPSLLTIENEIREKLEAARRMQPHLAALHLIDLQGCYSNYVHYTTADGQTFGSMIEAELNELLNPIPEVSDLSSSSSSSSSSFMPASGPLSYEHNKQALIERNTTKYIMNALIERSATEDVSDELRDLENQLIENDPHNMLSRVRQALRRINADKLDKKKLQLQSTSDNEVPDKGKEKEVVTSNDDVVTQDVPVSVHDDFKTATRLLIDEYRKYSDESMLQQLLWIQGTLQDGNPLKQEIADVIKSKRPTRRRKKPADDAPSGSSLAPSTSGTHNLLKPTVVNDSRKPTVIRDSSTSLWPYLGFGAVAVIIWKIVR